MTAYNAAFADISCHTLMSVRADIWLQAATLPRLQSGASLSEGCSAVKQCPSDGVAAKVGLDTLCDCLYVRTGPAEGVAASGGGQQAIPAGSPRGVWGSSGSAKPAGRFCPGFHGSPGLTEGFGSIQGGRALPDGDDSSRYVMHMPT